MEQSTDYRMLSPRHRSERETRPSLAVWLGQSPDTKYNNLLSQPPESRKHALPSPDADVGVLNRPFKLPQYPPPSYSQTRETTFSFSDTHRTELAPIKSMGKANGDSGNQGNDKLPSLSSITSPTPLSPSPSTQHYESSSSSSLQRPPEAPPPLTHWPSLNPLTAYYTPSHVQNPEPPMRMDVDPSSSSRRGASASSVSPDRFQDGRSSSVSLDDPDVRMAAEALGSLRAGQFSLAHASMAPSPSIVFILASSLFSRFN
jgi:transcriptional repressor OPI1